MSRAERRRQRKQAKKSQRLESVKGPTTRNPKDIQQALDLAVQHHTAGRLPEAESLYQQILQADPNQPDALHLLGVIAHQVGKNDIAVDLITKALSIKPHYVDAHNNLGNALKDLGRLDEAVASYHKALSFKPHHAEAHNNLGSAFKDLGRLDEAVSNYHKALVINPGYTEAHNNLGLVLKDLGRLDEAVASYQKAIDIKPDYAEAHNDLGAILQSLFKLDEAAASYQKAIEIKPDYAEAHNNLGTTLHDLGKLEEAVASYHKALAIKPDYVATLTNLGVTLKDQGKLDEAITCYRKAIAIQPDYGEGHLNLSFSLLVMGRLKEGVDEYEWRWRTAGFASMARSFSQPLWDGIADLKGRTLLFWCEQGPQDMTIWSSCLPHVNARGAHCIVECPPKLIPLYARSFPDVEVRTGNRGSNAERDDFDFHLPMGSLFRHFLPELAEDSEPKAFLVPDPDRVAFWKKRLGEIGSGPFVGISWKSPAMTPRRRQNYTELADWAPVFANRDAVFVNLQCKDFEDDLAAAKRDFGVTVHNFEDLDHYDNLDDVAALAGALDVAISVSTAVAAISAGVGAPTWVISWRQSSWNNLLLAPRGPSVRFFQRDTGESWDAVFESIAECLAATDF